MKFPILVAAALVAGAMTLSGCGTPQPAVHYFAQTPAAVLQPPPADKAQIVFLMPKNLFNQLQAVVLYDLTDENKDLFAMAGSQSKAVYLSKPGHRIFMSSFGAHNHIMEANLEAGKRYYVLLRFIYNGGFQLRPIRVSGPSDYSVMNADFKGWVSGTTYVEKTPAAEALHEKTKAGVPALQAAEWARFMSKTAAQRAELTLNVEDAYLN